MKKLLAIGEALIDFIPQEKGCTVKDVSGFSPKVGGAPANVCGAFVALGGEGSLITQLGQDAFGDKIMDELQKYGIGTEFIKRTKKANTSLAFVSHTMDGNRDFAFYRNPGADMLLSPGDIRKGWFQDCFGLHFCSVSLGDFPMKEASKKAIKLAASCGGIISFDPNLRFPLWEDPNRLKEAVFEFLPFADILKISEEELLFLTGTEEIEQALKPLMTGSVKLIIYTKGGDGAQCYTKSCTACVEGKKLDAVDTTGAGDGFIGAFLYELAKEQITKETISGLSEEKLTLYLSTANEFCAKSVMKHGAIASYSE